MDHYIEIHILPEPQLPSTILMSTLFAKLHHALFQEGRGEIGVSFPAAQQTLGDRIRLHGTKQALDRLLGLNWLSSLKDYVSESAIMPVPTKCMYRVIKRVQVKSGPERIYRRSVKKGKITLEEAEKRISDHKDKMLKEPFVQLKSLSSGQAFYLFIKQGEILAEARHGIFSNYGMSSEATVPWF